MLVKFVVAPKRRVYHDNQPVGNFNYVTLNLYLLFWNLLTIRPYQYRQRRCLVRRGCFL